MGNLDKIQKVGNWFSTILLGETKELIVRIDERTSRLAEDMRDIKPKVDSMSPKVDVLWDVWKNKYAPAGSPRQLNETGQGILNSSGIKEIIDGKKDELLDIVKTHNPNNSYDAEQTILDVVANLQKHFPDVVDDLKNGAFRSGMNIPTVLYVGGVYLRNLIFPDLGFQLEDLDKPKDGEIISGSA